jgi:hypothetical protein
VVSNVIPVNVGATELELLLGDELLGSLLDEGIEVDGLSLDLDSLGKLVSLLDVLLLVDELSLQPTITPVAIATRSNNLIFFFIVSPFF